MLTLSMMHDVEFAHLDASSSSSSFPLSSKGADDDRDGGWRCRWQAEDEQREMVVVFPLCRKEGGEAKNVLGGARCLS